MNVCMVAYAHYLNDARIKSYVRTLEEHRNFVDVLALRADGETPTEARANGTTFRVMSKYQGQSTFMYAWSYIRFFIQSALFFARSCFRTRYDVIHVHNMPNALVFSAIAARLLGAKVFLDVHDLMTVNYMAKFKVPEEHFAVKLLKFEQWFSALFADHVFCADHNQQEYLTTQCGVPRRKTTVLMNLPDLHLFRPTESATASDVFRIVYHGTIAHRLGIDLLVKAMASVVERIPAELWIYGAGDYLPDVLGLTSQLRLEDKIHFSRKFFPVEEIPDIVSGMDLGVIGNRRNIACDRYMLPVKLLEYAYLGIPVVAPRLDVISRYFDERMVRFYEPENVEQLADAIVELAGNRKERQRLARMASTFYQTHNIQAQGDLYLTIMASSRT